MHRQIMEKGHPIDWKNASFVFSDKSKEVLRMVESAPTLKLPNFNLFSGFYSLSDNIAQDIVSELCHQ